MASDVSLTIVCVAFHFLLSPAHLELAGAVSIFEQFRKKAWDPPEDASVCVCVCV